MCNNPLIHRFLPPGLACLSIMMNSVFWLFPQLKLLLTISSTKAIPVIGKWKLDLGEISMFGINLSAIALYLGTGHLYGTAINRSRPRPCLPVRCVHHTVWQLKNLRSSLDAIYCQKKCHVTITAALPQWAKCHRGACLQFSYPIWPPFNLITLKSINK